MRDRGRVRRVRRRRDVDPDAGLDVNSGRLAIRAQHIGVLDLLEIGQSVEIDVHLPQKAQAAIGDIAGDLGEFERLDRFVQFQEAIRGLIGRQIWLKPRPFQIPTRSASAPSGFTAPPTAANTPAGCRSGILPETDVS